MRGQTTDSVAISPAIRVVASSCEERLAIALQRLDKTLDAYEKATNALTSAVALNGEHVTLENLLRDQRDALRDLVKDVLADNKFLRESKGTTKSKIRKFLETVEKIILVGVGVYLGGIR